MLTFEEKTMIPIINAGSQKLVEDTFGYKWEDSGVMNEVNSGFGIADLVIFNRGALALEANNGRTVFLDSEDQVRTLFVVNEHQKFSITDLSERLSFSRARLKNQIRLFEEAGFVREVSRGAYEVVNQYNIGPQNNIAVEAKIRDWRRGLYQAYRYRWFSNASYLAIHHQFSTSPKNNIQEFIKLNVGLIEVFDDRLSIIYKPQLEEPLSPVITALAYEQILARFDD